MVVLAIVSIPAPSTLRAVGPSFAGPSARSPAANGLSARATWNGVDVASAGSASSAILLDFNQAVNVRYFWNYTGTGAAYNLTDGRLAMMYFGTALSTRDVPPIAGSTGSSGSFYMDWSAGAVEYVLGGVFGLTASLIASNGSTIWSESFFVRLVPIYQIGAALPILLILIVIFELYSAATSGRQAALRVRKSSPPKSPPAEEEADTPTPPAPGGGS